ncbi:unnamed protein product [Urochloa humidicola]
MRLDASLRIASRQSYNDIACVRDSEDWLFDEEDYMLLQGNNITCISLSKPRNKFKRWKKAGKESEMDEHGS